MNALVQRIAVLSLLIATTSVATAGTITWSGSDALAHVNTNWSDANNWVGRVPPGTGDTAFFDNSDLSFSPGGGAEDNIVASNITVEALWYAETNTALTNWHNTVISAGKTLTIANTSAAIVLDSGTQTDPAAGNTACY